ncbi:MAG: DEAD/DEAH box helicase [Chloroflexota bacterium]|nr:DEAD/DEAH box helicase [Chloroflexota bacterium]
MNTFLSHLSFNKDELRKRQEQFLVAFVKSDAPPYQCLVAPAGTGKSYTAIRVVTEMIAAREATRVLILVDGKALQNYVVARLRDQISDLPVIGVDKRVFREIDVSVEAGTSPWSRPVVAVMNLHVAVQEDVASSIVGATWDLVVVDTSSDLTIEQLTLIELFRHGLKVQRLLLVLPPQTKDNVVGFQTTSWVDEGKTAPPVIKSHVVEYERTKEEVEFFLAVREFAAAFDAKDNTALRQSLFLRAASSSLYAIEQSLRNRLNALTNQLPLSLTDVDPEASVDVTDELSAETLSAHRPGEMEAITLRQESEKLLGLIELLEDVGIDAKLQTLLATLNQITKYGDAKYIVIFTTFARTSSYLHSSLMEAGYTTYSITGGTSVDENARILAEYRQNGALLVATTAGLKGLEVGPVSIIINYDLPLTRDEWYVRLTRASDFGPDGTLTIINFRDKTGVLPDELKALELASNLLQANDQPT